jgi:hypothetical protein
LDLPQKFSLFRFSGAKFSCLLLNCFPQGIQPRLLPSQLSLLIFEFLFGLERGLDDLLVVVEDPLKGISPDSSVFNVLRVQNEGDIVAGRVLIKLTQSLSQNRPVAGKFSPQMHHANSRL